MRPLGHYRASTDIPPALAPLRVIAYDFRWCWRPELRDLFRDVDLAAWNAAAGNPVEFLRIVDPRRLAEKAGDGAYLARLSAAAESLAHEDRSEPQAAEASVLVAGGNRIAYFCFEYGLTEVLPIYSGGLGVLAGDHLKSASDIGIPLAAVGLFYREGFFLQTLTADGWQKESYPVLNPDDLPIEVLKTPSGRPPIVHVRIADRDVALLVRVARIGRVKLLLLDSHLPENRPADREITTRLYFGDLEMRIRQEMVLGIGGLRAFDLAGWTPHVRHANEGHAAFLALEKIRQLRAEMGLSFDEAREIAAAGNVFTTHTPVPAGIDLFPPEMIRKYFANKVDGYGITLDRLIGLGRQVPEDASEKFSMAVLGLHLSSHVNGVSRLHSTVSRRLWRGVFPEAPLSEIPITAVTNGVHPPTWTAPSIAEVTRGRRPEEVDRGELWRRHEVLRHQLVAGVRERVAAARRRRGAPDSEIEAAGSLLDPNALTISFARRFATYKRATLIFQDRERIARLLSVPGRPVQLLFAGKAHPQDLPGKEFLHRVGQLSLEEPFRGKVVLLEGYDMGLARLLVQGTDVWLNTPRRPLEASGTSGMKAAMNGALNLSILDGWWDEAPRDAAGFGIGDEEEGRSDEEMSAALTTRLENDVVPLFYDREGADRAGMPRGWVDRMAAAATTLGRAFSTDRMLRDYLRWAYLPAAERTRRLTADGARGARELAAWKARVGAAFPKVEFVGVKLSVPEPARLAPGTPFGVEVEIRLGALEASDVAVDWFEGVPDADNVVDAGYSNPLTLVERVDGRAIYGGTVIRPDDDSRGYSVRLRPCHPELTHPNEMGLVLWAG